MILKPRIVIDKPGIMDDYPWFLVLPLIVFYKLGFLDLLCTWRMQISINLSFKVVS